MNNQTLNFTEGIKLISEGVEITNVYNPLGLLDAKEGIEYYLVYKEITGVIRVERITQVNKDDDKLHVSLSRKYELTISDYSIKELMKLNEYMLKHNSISSTGMRFEYIINLKGCLDYSDYTDLIRDGYNPNKILIPRVKSLNSYKHQDITKAVQKSLDLGVIVYLFKGNYVSFYDPLANEIFVRSFTFKGDNYFGYEVVFNDYVPQEIQEFNDENYGLHVSQYFNLVKTKFEGVV